MHTDVLIQMIYTESRNTCTTQTGIDSEGYWMWKYRKNKIWLTFFHKIEKNVCVAISIILTIITLVNNSIFMHVLKQYFFSFFAILFNLCYFFSLHFYTECITEFRPDMHARTPCIISNERTPKPCHSLNITYEKIHSNYPTIATWSFEAYQLHISLKLKRQHVNFTNVWCLKYVWLFSNMIKISNYFWKKNFKFYS